MNILFLSTHLNVGGITVYLLTLLKGLKKRGHTVYLATSGGQLTDEVRRLGGEHLTLNIKTKSELDPRLYIAVGRLIPFIQKKKIQILHSQTRVTQVMGELLSLGTGRPLVTTCHGFYRNRLSRRWWPCWGDAVIAISSSVQEYLEKNFRIPREKIFMIHNGIDVSRFSVLDEQSRRMRRQQFNLGPGPVMGMVARLSDVKGHAILIQALAAVLKKFPTTQLLIAGEGREQDNLQRLVNELHLEKSVQFLPGTHRPEEILPCFDISVFPSLAEGLGLSILEAQAFGLPVIASRVGGIPSLIEHGTTGLLVSPGDPDELAGAITQVLSDAELARRLGRQASDFVRREFTEDKMVEETFGVYDGVLKSKR